MPIYEYACKRCEHTLDALQKMSEEPLVDCPECGEPELKRLISAPNFRLKGGGWYETDFKKDGQRNVHKNENDSAKSASGGDGKSGGDSKASGDSKSSGDTKSTSSTDSKASSKAASD
jgi:putative FmdB family regulatory protein